MSRKKRWFPIILLSIMMLLCSCTDKKPEDESVPEEASVSEASESEETSESEEVLESEGSEETIQETTEEAIEETYSDEYCFNVLETESIRIDCYVTFDRSHEGVCYYLRLFNPSDRICSVYIDSWIINDQYQVDENCSITLLEDQEDLYRFQTLSMLQYDTKEAVTKLAGHIRVSNVLDQEVTLDTDFQFELPEKIRYRQVYLPCRGAYCENQVLEDNDEVRITLLEAGRLLDDSWQKNDFRGTLLIENRTRQSQPVRISQAAINGNSMEVQSDSMELAAGVSRYLDFYVDDDDLDDQGITGISDLSLQILWNQDQNTGSVGYDGGLWYPLTLSESQEDEGTFEVGEILAEEAGITIGFVEATSESKSYSFYKWKFSVQNDRDEDVQIDFDNILADNYETYEKNPYMSGYGRIAAHGRTYIYCEILYHEPGIACPGFTFNVNVLKQGKGKILHQFEKEIRVEGVKEP